MRSRFERAFGRPLVVVAILGVFLAMPALVLFGPPLPGPNVGEWVGVASPPDLTPCTPRQAVVRSPASPPPPPGSWRQEPRTPLSRTELSGVAVGDRILTLAGQPPSREVVAFDPRSRQYRRETRLPVAVDHALTVEHAGDLYVLGGWLQPEEGEVAGKPTGRMWRYEPGSGRWSELPAMRRARGGLMGGVIDGKIYAVSGGPNPFPKDKTPYRDVEVFDIATGRWSPAPPIPTSRHHGGAAVLDGKLYVVGGRRTGDYSLSAFERFDPAAGTWEELPPLPLGAGDLRAVAAAGQIVAIGGDDEIGWNEGGGYITPATWAYDPGKDRWRRLPDLRQPRHGFAAGAIGDRVFVFEGSPCPGHGYSNTAESLRVTSPAEPR